MRDVVIKKPESSSRPSLLSVVILEHPCQKSKEGRYCIHQFAKEWRKLGHSVTIHYGVQDCPPADILVLHVDLSVVPGEYLALADDYPVVINGGVRDIRKAHYSENLVTAGDGYEGPVIVKSSSNSAGVPERHAAISATGPRWLQTCRKVGWRLAHYARRRFPASRRNPHILYKSDYRIFPERARVPAAWFDAEDVIIERFRPEFHEGKYVLREWYFLGKSEFVNCETSEDPIITSGEKQFHLVQPVPPEIRAVREQLGMDYGKIDYAVDADGDAVLYDINKTVGVTNLKGVLIGSLCNVIPPGIEGFFCEGNAAAVLQ